MAEVEQIRLIVARASLFLVYFAVEFSLPRIYAP